MTSEQTWLQQKLQAVDRQAFQNDLQSWYMENHRDLPWRQTKDPYRVWVSEIMLQQTRVDTVIPYYENFMKKFPTMEVLAEAPEDEVLKAWEGLGYYSRVRNLQEAVQEVVANYKAEVPKDRKVFRKLKGVGPYTSGAVISIAFDQEEPAVDGNVMRVFSRICNIDEDIGKEKTKQLFEQVQAQFLEGAKPSIFNQAIMELGALICTPKSPGCLLCPVQNHCLARAEGKEEDLPVKSKKKAPSKKTLSVAVVQDDAGRVLLRKRPDQGLLAGMWEFPHVESSSENLMNDASSMLLKDHDVSAEIVGEIQYVEHTFTHLIWKMHVHRATVREAPVPSETEVWVTLDEAALYALPVSQQKILRHLKGE
ncbi:A/G-specific DNA-adenine glycosylase [Salsuginibacillus halophilus]|uniref:Adenine DNA glycosylase n=1 Tax=Salsuginibacillus halophilus TaxID=517424 RepID=A0A2P8HBQ7_9BACI|nr:A/G-specific adenine glycosylase [Salsuginibacillus halophilus]PSL43646.1 A/G-specific DNA-adenine glycosylase [Salsuginibacillus halophilus]